MDKKTDTGRATAKKSSDFKDTASASAKKAAAVAKEKLKAANKASSGFRKEFLEFINRGSVVDLAVGVAVGGAFTAIVNSLVNDLVMPIAGMLMGGVDLTSLALTIPNFVGGEGEVVLRYGNFLQNVVEFLIVAWVIFMIVKTMNRLRRKREKTC
ncbi:MAG: large conductance mechanosensitive channel protein MscL [Candidatus Saccharibacteria bacterium]|nr:large conductance mechanosensitive channel protein MscL [Candidatus Saccharibacteria bacterium]